MDQSIIGYAVCYLILSFCYVRGVTAICHGAMQHFLKRVHRCLLVLDSF